MSLEFSAPSSKYVEIADYAPHRTTPLTVCFWLKMPSLPGAGLSFNPVCKWDGNWLTQIHDDGSMIGAIRPISISSEGGPLSTGDWEFVHFTMPNGTGFSRIGFNVTDFGSLADPGPLDTDPTPLRFGTNIDSEDFLTGELEDVRIYSRVLDNTELGLIYNGGAGGGIDVDGVLLGLVSNWQLVGPPGTSPIGAGSVLDWKGGRNGTPTNSPIYRQGLIPQSGSPKTTKRAFTM